MSVTVIMCGGVGTYITQTRIRLMDGVPVTCGETEYSHLGPDDVVGWDENADIQLAEVAFGPHINKLPGSSRMI